MQKHFEIYHRKEIICTKMLGRTRINSIQNMMAFVLFLTLHHFSGIICLILFALGPFTYLLEETPKPAYFIIKAFLT